MNSPLAAPMFVTSASCLAFGLFVLSQNVRSKLNRLFMLLCLAVAWWSFGYGLVNCTQDPNRVILYARFGFIGVAFIPTFFYHFMIEFLAVPPTRRLKVFYGTSLAFLVLAQTDYFMSGTYSYAWGLYPKAGPTYAFFLVFFYGLFLYCLFTLNKAYRTIRKMDRPHISPTQVWLVRWAYVVATLSVSDYLPNYQIDVIPFAYLAAAGWLGVMAYACFRYSLMDIRFVIRRTLVYSLVTAVITLIYVYFVVLGTSWTHGTADKKTLLSSAVPAAIIAFLFHPLFKAIQSFVDRLFLQVRADRAAKLAEFSDRALREEDSNRVLSAFWSVLEDTFHPHFAVLYVRSEEGEHLTRLSAMPSGPGLEDRLEISPWMRTLPPAGSLNSHLGGKRVPVVTMPVFERGEFAGCVLLGERRSGEPYQEDDLVLLRVLVNQMALALERPKLLNEFSGAFTHEIKTPLASISLPAELTYLEMLDVEKGRLSLADVLPKVKTRMKHIVAQANVAGQRIEAVRELMGTASQTFTVFSVKPVLEKAASSLKEAAGSAGVEVVLDVRDGLGSVNGSARQIEIVAANIMKNAIEAMTTRPEGERRLQVTGQSTADKVTLTFADTGEGIAEKDRPHVFEARFTTKGDAGTGMGLFLSRQIIRAHGGSIEVAANEPFGSRFVVTLPRCA